MPTLPALERARTTRLASSPLQRGLAATDPLGDPGRRVWRRAPRRGRVVDQHLEPLADGDGPATMLRMVDADLGQAMVHRPLLAFRRRLQLLLDLVEQAIQVDADRPLRHPLGGQA